MPTFYGPTGKVEGQHYSAKYMARPGKRALRRDESDNMLLRFVHQNDETAFMHACMFEDDVDELVQVSREIYDENNQHVKSIGFFCRVPAWSK